jgi:hypothetical protein
MGLACALELAIAAGPDSSKDHSAVPKLSPQESSCGSFGTRVEFVNSPSEAARRAKQDEKLVFVLHVSGHFEDPRFT